MYKKIAVTLIGVLVVFGLASMTILATKVHEKSAPDQTSLIIEKIESYKGSTIIDSFIEEPSRVAVISNDLIEVEGTHKEYGVGLYQINMKDMTVNQLDLPIANIDPGTYNVLKKSAFGLVLGMKDGHPGLYHQTNDGALKKISSNYLAGDHSDLKISSSGDKLIYLVRESEQMATYSLKTFKRKVVPGVLPSAVLDDFDKSVVLSPDGGYFMIFEGMGAYTEHKINVYGADSGRKYAAEIEGTLPVWSPTGERLAFVYAGQLENNLQLKNTRVGYINFPERQIVYFDKMGEDQMTASELTWNNDGSSLSYIRMNLGDNSSELRSYGVEEEELYSFSIHNLEAEANKMPSEIVVDSRAVTLYWEGDKRLSQYDLDGVRHINRERIDTIKGFGPYEKPFMVSDENVLYYQDDQIKINGFENLESLETEGIERVGYNSDFRWIVTGMPSEDGYTLNILSTSEL